MQTLFPLLLQLSSKEFADSFPILQSTGILLSLDDQSWGKVGAYLFLLRYHAFQKCMQRVFEILDTLFFESRHLRLYQF